LLLLAAGCLLALINKIKKDISFIQYFIMKATFFERTKNCIKSICEFAQQNALVARFNSHRFAAYLAVAVAWQFEIVKGRDGRRRHEERMSFEWIFHFAYYCQFIIIAG